MDISSSFDIKSFYFLPYRDQKINHTNGNVLHTDQAKISGARILIEIIVRLEKDLFSCKKNHGQRISYQHSSRFKRSGTQGLGFFWQKKLLQTNGAI